MGGTQIPRHSSGDDGFNEDGYDESQRAEILEVINDGPTDGAVQTDLQPDLIHDSDGDEDDLQMVDGEIAQEDEDIDPSEDDIAEDEAQADFDDADDDLDEDDDDLDEEDAADDPIDP